MSERIKGLENALKERETDYGILEDKYSNIVKKEDQGPIVFVGNIISIYHINTSSGYIEVWIYRISIYRISTTFYEHR